MKPLKRQKVDDKIYVRKIKNNISSKLYHIKHSKAREHAV